MISVQCLYVLLTPGVVDPIVARCVNKCIIINKPQRKSYVRSELQLHGISLQLGSSLLWILLRRETGACIGSEQIGSGVCRQVPRVGCDTMTSVELGSSSTCAPLGTSITHWTGLKPNGVGFVSKPEVNTSADNAQKRGNMPVEKWPYLYIGIPIIFC